MSVKDKVNDFLEDRISLQEFNAWVWVDNWDKKAVNGIKLRLAEYSRGHWTKEELKQRLRGEISG